MHMETWSYETHWTALLRHIHFCSSVFYRQLARVHDIASEAMSARSNIFFGQLALSQETSCMKRTEMFDLVNWYLYV